MKYNGEPPFFADKGVSFAYVAEIRRLLGLKPGDSLYDFAFEYRRQRDVALARANS